MFARIARRAALGAAPAAMAAAAYYAPAHAEAPAAGLDPKNWVPLKLVEKTPLTDNTAIYRFAFTDPAATSGMTVASLLMVKAPIGSEKPDGSRANVLRPYTPLSRPGEVGYLDLAVKAYPEGKMSKHIASLKVGDTLDFKGPILKKEYKPNQYASIGMIAGGTGITPMLQVVDEILANPADKTKVSLIFGNQTESDMCAADVACARSHRLGHARALSHAAAARAACSRSRSTRGRRRTPTSSACTTSWTRPRPWAGRAASAT